MKRRFAAAALLVAVATACGVPVAVESDAASRVAAARTWAWLPRPPVARGEVAYATVDERVRAAVARELGARRWKKVDNQRPDLLITYYAALDAPIPASAITYAAGVPSAAKSVSTYEQGALVLDVLDAKSGKLVWRGAGRRVFLPDQTAQERSARIDEAVASVVGELAPR